MATSEVIIQGGVTKVSENYYRYDFSNTSGYQTLFFTSSTVPKIGDKIVNNALVEATLPIINQDHSRWETRDYESWPDDVDTKYYKKT